MSKTIAAALGLGSVLICGAVSAQISQYQFVPNQVCWSQANAAAEAAGGHLVTIGDEEENDLVLGLTGGGRAWIGFTDQASEGDFVWVTGEPVTYTNWNAGEPNDSGGEDFVEIRDDGTWNDRDDCSSARTYVIEFERSIIPTLGTWGLALLAGLLVIVAWRFRRATA